MHGPACGKQLSLAPVWELGRRTRFIAAVTVESTLVLLCCCDSASRSISNVRGPSYIFAVGVFNPALTAVRQHQISQAARRKYSEDLFNETDLVISRPTFGSFAWCVALLAAIPLRLAALRSGTSCCRFCRTTVYGRACFMTTKLMAQKHVASCGWAHGILTPSQHPTCKADLALLASTVQDCTITAACLQLPDLRLLGLDTDSLTSN